MKRHSNPASGQVGPKPRKKNRPPHAPEQPEAEPSSRLRFEDGDAPQAAPATSGQVGPKSKRPKGGKFRQDGERARLSERLRREGEPEEPHGPVQEAPKDEAPGDPKTKQEARTKKAQTRADKAGAKLENAKEKRAAQKPQKPPSTGKKAFRAARGGAWAYTHNKIHQVEHENVGTEGAHKAELAAEAGGRKLTRYTKRRIREHPVRVVEKWEYKTVRANADLHFQKMAGEHPELNNTPISRFIQKQKIRRDYQKKARQAAKNGTKAAQKTGSAMEKLARAVGGAIKRHPIGALLLLLLFAMFMILNSAFSALPILGTGMMNAVVGTSYTSENADLLAVEESYVSLENGLQTRIDNIERDHSGYDEYRYHLDEIIHNPHELASYLTALYKTYTLSDVGAELQRVFEKQYTLTLTEIVEVRYRTETHTDADGNEYDEEVDYNYYILDVELTNRPIASFAPSLLNAEQLEMFGVYLATSGNKPLIFGGGSPDGTPSEDLGGVHFENGTRPGNPAVIAIAKSQVGNVGGQPYWSWYGFDNRVAWCACFVSWCYNRAGVSEPRFAACASQGIPWFQAHGQWGDRNYPDIASGDAIFFDWEGDGRADHVGLVVGTDGERVYTVEGNSGNACKIKSYPVGSSLICGYGLMNWD